uniref:uncharacterized protein LOC120348200 n=1 Tax=Styela clava TaxID=7725 RepID=UPI001939B069|nr:uncharacterized protein LOC120348200 [Styela clava]
MDETLRMKKVKPKTYLTQVILYENVSHDRLLDQKLGQLKHRHRVIEKKIKRKRESFVQQLENKQNEWTKLDARVIQKFEPENMPDLSFKFGRLYHSANYPYQAAINALRGIPSEKSNHTRKPQVLPQITRKKNRKESIPSDSESGSSNVFITKLPKKSLDKKEESMKSSEDPNPKLEEVNTSWEKLNEIQPAFGSTRPNAINKKELPPVRGRRPQKIPPIEKNWLEDSRYVTLTSLLGPRFSPSKKFRRHDLPSANLAW